MIYTLIRVYELKNENNDMSNYKLPYEGVYKDKSVVFDLEKLPKRLKRILFNFLKKHKKAMDEEVSRP